jgi:hypothetical protein
MQQSSGGTEVTTALLRSTSLLTQGAIDDHERDAAHPRAIIRDKHELGGCNNGRW